jgi:hypothetical protein
MPSDGLPVAGYQRAGILACNCDVTYKLHAAFEARLVDAKHAYVENVVDYPRLFRRIL